jgi:glycosyltransferase involved in cell wall biosynthesis
MTQFAQANTALRAKRHAEALRQYVEAMQGAPGLAPVMQPNHAFARGRYLKERTLSARPRVLVCGWDLSRNAAGRVFTLAQLYESLADVGIIGCFFPQKGRELWPPVRQLSLPVHPLRVEEESRFAEQAAQWVVQHPGDLVHLSKPRFPNIVIGLLYKLIWGSRVIVDIDDEELAFVSATEALSLEDHLQAHHRLPNPADLTGPAWTRIGVGLATAFDGVTVANPALQQRYGGALIRHARDENLFKPSAALRQKSRATQGIAPGQKVVLFLGTPRAHKGLLETAQALASLEREDVLFLVAGDFPPSLQKLKAGIEALPHLKVRLLGDQPFESLPDLLAAGDICVLLQDPESLAARFQTPAKLSDALAMGLTVVAEPTPGLADLAEAFQPVTRATLAATLAEVLGRAPADPSPHPVFNEKLSFAANRPLLQAVLEHVTATPLSLPLHTLARRQEFGPLLPALLGKQRPATVPPPPAAPPETPGRPPVTADPGAYIQQATHAMATGDWTGAYHCWKALSERQGGRLSIALLLRVSRELFRLDAFTDAAAALGKAAQKEAAHPGVIREQAAQYYYHCYSSWLMRVTENEPDWYKADGLGQRPDWPTACALIEKAEKAAPGNNPRRYVQAHLLLAEDAWDKQQRNEAHAALRIALNAIGPQRLDNALTQAILDAAGRFRGGRGDEQDRHHPALQDMIKALPLDGLTIQGWLCLNDLLNWNGLLLCGYAAREKAVGLALAQGQAHPGHKEILKTALKAALDRNDTARAGDFLDGLKRISPDAIDVRELDACCELMKGHLGAFRQKWPHPPAPAEQRLRDYLKGKSVAVVGPAPTGSLDGEEIDRFDVVVRMNWRGPENRPDVKEFGRRTDISLYNAHTVRWLKAKQRLDCVKTLDFCWVRRTRYDATEFSAKAGHICRLAEYPASFYKSLNAVPAALFNLLLHGAARVKLFKVNFYLGKQHHSDQYRGCTDDELAKTPLRKLQPVLANHDLISQINLVKFINPIFDAGFLSQMAYVKELEKISTSNSRKNNFLSDTLTDFWAKKRLEESMESSCRREPSARLLGLKSKRHEKWEIRP